MWVEGAEARLEVGGVLEVWVWLYGARGQVGGGVAFVGAQGEGPAGRWVFRFDYYCGSSSLFPRGYHMEVLFCSLVIGVAVPW